MYGKTVTDYNPETLISKRMELGMSQKGLADAIGTTYTEVAKWEIGAKGIPEETFGRLAFMLRCNVEDLMNGGKS